MGPMGNRPFRGDVGSFSTVTLDTSQTSADVLIVGDCVKVEQCSNGSTLQLLTNEGENPIAPLGRTWYSEKGFNSLKVSGYQPGEVVIITVGWGFIVDNPGQNANVPDYVAPGLLRYTGNIPAGGQTSLMILPGVVAFFELNAFGGEIVHWSGSFPGSIFGLGNAPAADAFDVNGTNIGISMTVGQYRFNVTGMTQVTFKNTGVHAAQFNLFVSGIGII